MSCPDCFRGGITTQHPQGTESKIHGRDTYIAQPDEGTPPKAIIVFLTDAFGWKFPNNRVLADHYAKRGGYLVYIPDFMDGGAMDPYGITIIDGIMKKGSWIDTLWKGWYILQAIPLAIKFKIYCNHDRCRPGVYDFLTALRTSARPYANTAIANDAAPPKPMKIGAAGFCWGGKFCAWLSADKPEERVVRHESQLVAGMGSEAMPLIDCAFTAHPSLLEIPGDIERVQLPFSVAIGDKDFGMKEEEIQKMKQILDAKPDTEGKYECNIIPGANHGFAVRSHPEDEKEMKAALEAEDQALAFFDKWLVKD